MRLIVATGHGHDGLWHDEQHLPAAFAAHGIELDVKHWMDIEPDGTPILIRTTWDYTQHANAFRSWLDRIEATQTPCINAPAVLRWNMDKRYLIELESRGHAIVPTVVVATIDHACLLADGPTIAKPVVGGGAEGLHLIRDGVARPFDTSGNTWGAAEPLGPFLVQPFIDGIDAGEWSLFFFGGAYSHAILKRPAAGDIRVQEEHGGTTAAADPPAHVREAAAALVADVDALVARVDGVDVDGRFLLMELELIEPELYFRNAQGAEERFAAAVADQL